MKGSFISPMIAFIIEFFKLLNLVEILKELVEVFWFDKSIEEKKSKKIFIIDFYILCKWGIIFIFWYFNNHFSEHIIKLVTYFTYYLLITNVFTYFYYHIWIEASSTNIERERRRFISLIQSFLFSSFAFSYLYRFNYFNEYKWGCDYDGISENLKAVALSFGTIFGGSIVEIEAQTEVGIWFSLFHIFINFLFVAIILSNTCIEKQNT